MKNEYLVVVIFVGAERKTVGFVTGYESVIWGQILKFHSRASKIPWTIAEK